MNKTSLHILLILTGLLLAACSAERNNPLSKTYHNTTARYNGYFLAKEKMRLIEEGLQEQMQYDYNQVLPIYPIIDSTTATAFEADLEDVKKKASHPIQYHKNSKWIDNSYIEIGKANYYQLNFAEAVRTFKYVNATSKDAADRHEALVWLMRAFMQLDEMDNAQQVSEYLRKERLNKANARELYLARAQYHRLQNDTAKVIENLALSLPNFDNRDDQSRARYTLAQLYQLTKQNKEAYEQYSKVLRRNPPYDLGFFSRLNLGQVTELSDEEDKERIVGYYQKMLKDDKNIEYRDKIYYEMAQFELRQQNYDKALVLLQQSLKTKGALSNQKAYSYLSAGEIYFDKLSKYDLAAAYYDSAVQVYPQRAPEYEAVAERRDVLADFAKQYSTIQMQDSLQRLGRMSEEERVAFVQALVQREEEARQQEMAKQQERQLLAEKESSRGNNRRSQNNDAFAAASSSTGVWYFDNPTAVASARAEFVRRWGDRPLQDFWRNRTRGEAGSGPADVALAPVPVEAEENQPSPEARASAQVQQYLRDVPVTTADMQRSEKLVEDALFRLANIYAQNLNDQERAIQTYLSLLQRFLRTEYAAESYYSLYLLYSKAGDEQQKQAYYHKVKQEFPNTTFARLLDDSDFMSKNAAENLKAHALYDSAFNYYDAEEYEKTTKVINQIVSQYPLNDIQDKVVFLRAMVTARTQKPETLRQQLLQFKAAYPKSPLLPQANQLLATYQELEKKNQLRQDAPASPEPKAPNTSVALTPEEKVSTNIAAATVSVAKGTPQVLPPAPVVLPEEAKVQRQDEQNKPNVARATPPVVEQEAQPLAAAETPADSVSAPVPPVPAVDPLAYEATDDSAFYFVLIYPTDAPAFKDVQPKYEKYNSTYYRNQNLSIDSVALADGKTMLLMRAFTDPKLALSYNVKQKAPQAPVGRIRGVDFTTFVISSANYQKFLQKRDPEAYLAFFKNNY